MSHDTTQPTPNRALRRANERRGRKLAALGSGMVLATGAVGALGVIAAGPAGAITVTNLDDSGAGSLRQALADASDGDVIDLSGLTGTITLTSGQLEITDVVTIVGPGAGLLTVDGDHNDRVFSMEGGISGTATVTISGITITGGDVEGPGAGIYFDCDGDSANSLEISGVVLTGNTGTDLGGGLYFDRCDEDGEGDVQGDLIIRNSVISNNSTTDDGGGVWFDQGDELLIVNSTIADNTASAAGGVIYDDGNTLTIVNSTFSGNRALSGAGGGLLLDELDGTATISNSTFNDNHALDGNGGGIAVSSGSLVLLQTTISGNTASDLGDGLYLSGEGYIDAASAQQGDGDDGASAQDAEEVTITGSIISGNNGSSDDISGEESNALTVGSSVIGTIDSNIQVTNAGGNQLDVAAPGLAALANNGGPTKTMALLTGSPALNMGPATVPVFPGNTFDQRGPGFDRVVSGRVDVGAYEVQLPPTPAPEVIIAPKFTG